MSSIVHEFFSFISFFKDSIFFYFYLCLGVIRTVGLNTMILCVGFFMQNFLNFLIFFDKCSLRFFRLHGTHFNLPITLIFYPKLYPIRFYFKTKKFIIPFHKIFSLSCFLDQIETARSFNDSFDYPTFFGIVLSLVYPTLLNGLGSWLAFFYNIARFFFFYYHEFKQIVSILLILFFFLMVLLTKFNSFIHYQLKPLNFFSKIFQNFGRSSNDELVSYPLKKNIVTAKKLKKHSMGLEKTINESLYPFRFKKLTFEQIEFNFFISNYVHWAQNPIFGLKKKTWESENRADVDSFPVLGPLFQVDGGCHTVRGLGRKSPRNGLVQWSLGKSFDKKLQPNSVIQYKNSAKFYTFSTAGGPSLAMVHGFDLGLANWVKFFFVNHLGQNQKARLSFGENFYHGLESLYGNEKNFRSRPMFFDTSGNYYDFFGQVLPNKQTPTGLNFRYVLNSGLVEKSQFVFRLASEGLDYSSGLDNRIFLLGNVGIAETVSFSGMRPMSPTTYFFSLILASRIRDQDIRNHHSPTLLFFYDFIDATIHGHADRYSGGMPLYLADKSVASVGPITKKSMARLLGQWGRGPTVSFFGLKNDFNFFFLFQWKNLILWKNRIIVDLPGHYFFSNVIKELNHIEFSEIMTKYRPKKFIEFLKDSVDPETNTFGIAQALFKKIKPYIRNVGNQFVVLNVEKGNFYDRFLIKKNSYINWAIMLSLLHPLEPQAWFAFLKKNGRNKLVRDHIEKYSEKQIKKINHGFSGFRIRNGIDRKLISFHQKYMTVGFHEHRFSTTESICMVFLAIFFFKYLLDLLVIVIYIYFF